MFFYSVSTYYGDNDDYNEDGRDQGDVAGDRDADRLEPQVRSFITFIDYTNVLSTAYGDDND